MNASQHHLNDAQFTDCMLGIEPAPDTKAHLSECEACREELAHVRKAIGDLGTAGLAWSARRHPERRSAGLSAGTRRLPVAAWGAAAFAMLALGVSPLLHRESPLRETGTAAVAESADDSAAQIEQDNRLMQAVNLEIAEREPSPYNEYRLGHGNEPRTKSQVALRMQ